MKIEMSVIWRAVVLIACFAVVVPCSCEVEWFWVLIENKWVSHVFDWDAQDVDPDLPQDQDEFEIYDGLSKQYYRFFLDEFVKVGPFGAKEPVAQEKIGLGVADEIESIKAHSAELQRQLNEERERNEEQEELMQKMQETLRKMTTQQQIEDITEREVQSAMLAAGLGGRGLYPSVPASSIQPGATVGKGVQKTVGKRPPAFNPAYTGQTGQVPTYSQTMQSGQYQSVGMGMPVGAAGMGVGMPIGVGMGMMGDPMAMGMDPSMGMTGQGMDMSEPSDFGRRLGSMKDVLSTAKRKTFASTMMALESMCQQGAMRLRPQAMGMPQQQMMGMQQQQMMGMPQLNPQQQSDIQIMVDTLDAAKRRFDELFGTFGKWNKLANRKTRDAAGMGLTKVYKIFVEHQAYWPKETWELFERGFRQAFKFYPVRGLHPQVDKALVGEIERVRVALAEKAKTISGKEGKAAASRLEQLSVSKNLRTIKERMKMIKMQMPDKMMHPPQIKQELLAYALVAEAIIERFIEAHKTIFKAKARLKKASKDQKCVRRAFENMIMNKTVLNLVSIEGNDEFQRLYADVAKRVKSAGGSASDEAMLKNIKAIKKLLTAWVGKAGKYVRGCKQLGSMMMNKKAFAVKGQYMISDNTVLKVYALIKTARSKLKLGRNFTVMTIKKERQAHTAFRNMISAANKQKNFNSRLFQLDSKKATKMLEYESLSYQTSSAPTKTSKSSFGRSSMGFGTRTTYPAASYSRRRY